MPVGKKGFGGLVSGETQQAVMMLGFRNLSKQRDQDSGIDKGLVQQKSNFLTKASY